ncbi:hypothetical protein PLANTIT3_50296 [Plantibacter sp. T3]|nr:hypothetical protein PLANTIT3_50296 [Plantibacter sp. T3]
MGFTHGWGLHRPIPLTGTEYSDQEDTHGRAAVDRSRHRSGPRRHGTTRRPAGLARGRGGPRPLPRPRRPLRSVDARRPRRDRHQDREPERPRRLPGLPALPA